MMKIKMHPTNARLKDAGYTIDQEEKIYDDQLKDIILNPRQYLDHSDTMVTYKVRWKNYRYTSPVLPYKYVKQTLIKNKHSN
jgi:hypothetical protein